jgi:site-specific recombinase XerD
MITDAQRFPARKIIAGKSDLRHTQETNVQREEDKVSRQCSVVKQFDWRAFRHLSATHLSGSGYNIGAFQEFFGHKDDKTTMIYTDVFNRGSASVRNPTDGS